MQRPEVIQQQLENWYSASIRALAAEPRVLFRAHRLYVRDELQHIQSPYLQLTLDSHEAQVLRGLADALALRILYSDRELHQKLMPNAPIEQLVFELLEQLRVESLAPRALPGMRGNIRKRFLYWANQTATSSLTENNIGLLIYSLLVICWSRLLNQPVPEQVEVEIEATRMGLAKTIGEHLYAFKALTENQSAFAEHSLSIARAINEMVGEFTISDQSGPNSSLEQNLNALLLNGKLTQEWLSGDNATWHTSSLPTPANDIIFDVAQFEYKIFSTKHDKVIETKKVVRAAQLKKLRAKLDKLTRQSSINSHRIARHLRTLVATPTTQGWSFGKEQGYLDSARLARLISSPNERRLFRQESHAPRSDCLISILIDNSGSMTLHSEVVASLVDTLVKIIDISGICSEVLGFTTGEWNGGRVYKEWIATGKPDNPGRLNSLCHLIYKSAETPWRRARPTIAGLLKTDLFREGIDGEALEWAMQRSLARPEKRKIILVISDGSPMDTTTHANNQTHYLDNHLSLVTQKIDSQSHTHLCAIGVGLDMSAYYKHNLAITPNEPLTNQDYHQIVKLLTNTE